MAEGVEYLVSPNRQYLAYLSPPGEDGKSVLRVAMLSGSLEKGADAFEISLNSYNSQMAWSPDNTSLAYTEGGKIWAVDIQSKERTQLASDLSMVTNLIWTAKNEIIFSGSQKDNTDGFNHIFRIQLK